MIRFTTWLPAAISALAVFACTPRQPPTAISELERIALADSVRESVREKFRTVDSIPCERPDSLLDHGITFAYGSFLYAADTTVVFVTRDEALDMMKADGCPSTVENAKLVEPVEVQVLTRDLAVVGWKFEEDRREPDGLRQRIQGVVLETRARTPTGWRATSGMGSHVKIGSPRMLPD